MKDNRNYSSQAFEEQYTYRGNDLGATWSAAATAFRVWVPTAEAVYVDLFQSGTDGADDRLKRIAMTPDENGTWIATVPGDWNGIYYTYAALIDGTERVAVDPYARTTGVNGKRAMVIDLDATNPRGWEEDINPHAGERITDAVIYELHVRDFSAHPQSGMKYAGKYLAFTEAGTYITGEAPCTRSASSTLEGPSWSDDESARGEDITASRGKEADADSKSMPPIQPTGIDYLADLGITHLHLLPVYDFGSVDESKEGGYNWGYDPVNYNVPEGSYSTNPYRGEVRVAEFKQMVQSLHAHGISVVMDVVYNHVYDAESFCFNVLVPGYFSRMDADGNYSNGSDCGNDTASERSMVRKYIVDSVVYWADEYHIDGFRFDLVGLLDTVTINEIVEKVHEKHPDVIFYGEGWSMDTHVTKKGVALATQKNVALTPKFAYFNDTIRDALNGSVFLMGDVGYVTGALGKADTVRDCFMAVNPWCSNPTQVINYASCHDNRTLFAKIRCAVGKRASFADQVKMNHLAAAICILSEGVPFVMSGEELLRMKERADGSYDANSYNSGDGVNALRWGSLLDPTCRQTHQYYKGLIAFRKAHPLLRLTSAEEIAERVKPISQRSICGAAAESNVVEKECVVTAGNHGFENGHIMAADGYDIEEKDVISLDENVIVMDIHGAASDKSEEEILVIFNPTPQPAELMLPAGKWDVYVNADAAGTKVLATVEGSISADAISATVLCHSI